MLAGGPGPALAALHSDVTNAGATWLDEAVHRDEGSSPLLVNSRNHETVAAFAGVLVEQFARHA